MVDSTYDVEVDLSDPLSWGVDIVPNEGSTSSTIVMSKDSARFTGILDSVDVDGYAVLRLGDYIIPFIGTGVSYATGTSVVVTTTSISLTPYDI